MDAMPRRTDDKNRYFNILPNNHSRYGFVAILFSLGALDAKSHLL